MYSYQKSTALLNASDFEAKLLWYDILDPDGDCICQVVSKGEAEALISHLNR